MPMRILSGMGGPRNLVIAGAIAAVLLIALIIGLQLRDQTVSVAPPSPSPSPSATPTPTASPSASPSPTPSPGPLNATTAVGTVPRSFHYFDIGQGESYRILLFDEDRTQPPVVVLTSGRPPVPPGPDVRSDSFTVSADGTVLVVMRRLSPQLMTYYVLRPETGEMQEVLNGPDLGLPVISPDGAGVAYARASDDPAVNGIWLSSLAPRRPAPTRLVSDVPKRVGSPPQPLAWSTDGSSLAIVASQGEGSQEIAVVDPSGGLTRYDAATNAFVGGRARVIGPGSFIDWRGGDAHLLVTSSRSLFGGRTLIYEANAITSTTRPLYVPSGDVNLGPAVWHPSLDRYALIERPVVGGPTAPSTVWVRRIDGTATSTSAASFLGPPWWSRDGTRLFSIGGGDDSNGGIVDLLTGSSVRFCVRAGIPPACQ